MKRFFILTLVITLGLLTVNQAKALEYTYCSQPNISPTCYVSFLRLRSMINPLSGKRFFEDGLHFENEKLFMYPSFHVATPDLDNDGYQEIVIALSDPELGFEGMFCKKGRTCLHYILQDRNLPNEKKRLSRFTVLGPIYTTGLGLSTDEVVGGYRSLRAYTDRNFTKFSVYQYDRKNDNYFNVSPEYSGGRP